MPNNKQKGYTIIETMIAVSLFIVIMTAGMGALLSANALSDRSQNIRSIMDNLSFIMEDMSRNLRTGSHYHCVTNPDVDLSALNVGVPRSGSSCLGIAFESGLGNPSDNNDQWVYFIGTNGQDANVRIFKATQGPYTMQSSFIQLTTDEIVIDPISGFSVLGAEPPPGDNQQPLITIKLIGKIIYKNVTTPFSLQTSVSERVIDI